MQVLNLESSSGQVNQKIYSHNNNLSNKNLKIYNICDATLYSKPVFYTKQSTVISTLNIIQYTDHKQVVTLFNLIQPPREGTE